MGQVAPSRNADDFYSGLLVIASIDFAAAESEVSAFHVLTLDIHHRQLPKVLLPRMLC